MKKDALKSIYEKLGEEFNPDRMIDRLSFSELQTLLLYLMEKKTMDLTPSMILKQYEEDSYVFPSDISQDQQHRLDLLLFSCLPPNTDTIELAPVAPLGTSSVIAQFNQSRVVSTIRKNEVSADPTNFLALEAAERRKSSKTIVRLASSQRVLRSERIKKKGTFSHFKLFSFCIAGKDEGFHTFEKTALVDILEFYDRMILKMIAEGYEFGRTHVKLMFPDNKVSLFYDKTIGQLDESLSHISIEKHIQPDENWSYYGNVRFKLFISDGNEDWFMADGGDVPWTQRLLNNRKERFFISGMGTERILSAFKKK